ncbi:MAG: Asp-tRNA(Asn)/Glu-tRNA(Gln) amidotransferase subunit GatA [Gemmatimonadaceae bacterium]|jgi:aspartyl-tRNA(Asn)/glutamyl-tRNA(Gln) amidotransferase subunit A|nr:Asp-tRNA(Asn)/Glu-tRNA(Gln) amidotransferase subunit GatA [Gemmatimonadaceae bacterium]
MSASLVAGPIAALVEATTRGGHSPRAMVDAALAAMDAAHVGPEGLNAVLWRDDAEARAEADRLSAAPPAHDAPLLGVPIVVKDNIATTILPTSCGSRLLDGYVSPFEATAVTRLRHAGAVIVGKANMDEFAMGSSTEHSAFGPTRNPVDPSRVPGGSSGGSAAAVASGAVRVALGSDTGGSVRQPAAYCGIVGVKPTYGRVSRHGLVAFGSSLDQIGVLARSIDDAARVMDVIAGHDPHDATSLVAPLASCREALTARLDGVVIGVPSEYFTDALDPVIRDRCERALDALRVLGATTREVHLPHTGLAIPVYYIVAPAEASSNLARFDGIRYGQRRVPPGGGLTELYETTRSAGFGPEVTRRILLGTYVLSAGYYDAYYRRAQAVRQRIRDDFVRVFASGVHALFTPTAPTVAFPFGAKADPYEMYLSDIYTVTANLAGVPALSLPIGRVGGLPVGGQLLTAHGDETTMFRVAGALEALLGEEAHR